MSGVNKGKPFIVPELESAPLPRTRPWTDAESVVVRKYFGRRDVRSIAAYLKEKYPPGRSIDAIRNKASKLEEI